MSIVITGLTFGYRNSESLFENLGLLLGDEQKASLVGANGAGKSTLLKIITGRLEPLAGAAVCSSVPYYVPQQVGFSGLTVAQAMGVDRKIAALRAISAGSLAQGDYDTLGDDWEVEARCLSALGQWGLGHAGPDTPMENLSGGEKTKVLLCGLSVSQPGVVLLDEPTNHLDAGARQRLYDYIASAKATVLVVSHDLTLLNMLPRTMELSKSGIKLYGGNYAFYREQKELQAGALEGDIHEQEKGLRQAKLKAQQVKERQQRREGRGERNKDQVVRILRKTMADRAAGTSKRLGDKHEQIVSQGREKLAGLRAQRDAARDLKIDFDDAGLHEGKLLVSLRGVNHKYGEGAMLWGAPLDLDLYSGERVRIAGDNGSGKTTLLKILMGQIEPAEGSVKRGAFRYVYLDQEYSMAETDKTVLELAMEYNHEKLSDHEVKTRLHRALFPAEMWDKPCRSLSGGERMRLCLCCLMLSDHVPDLFVLDEPTNNLDLPSLEILTRTLADYRGTVLLISHDGDFALEVGITREIDL